MRFIDRMFDTVVESTSLIVRGTLITALSLICDTPTIAEILERCHYHFFRYGRHQCIIPIDPEQILNGGDCIRMGDSDMSDSISIPESEICDVVRCLSNPHINRKAKHDLKALVYRSPQSTQNAVIAHLMMAKYSFRPDLRNYLQELFSETSLMEMSQADIDIGQEATAWTRVEIALEQKKRIDGEQPLMCDFAIPVYETDQLRNCVPHATHPEVYMSDTHFIAATGGTKQAFYELPEENRNLTRSTLTH